MYVIEGPANGFSSIPRSIYWAVVTLTTVGYGDITPQTNIGQFLSAVVMIMGYGVIAVPTGIVTVELSQTMKRHMLLVCHGCGAENHEADGKQRHLKPRPLPDRQLNSNSGSKTKPPNTDAKPGPD